MSENTNQISLTRYATMIKQKNFRSENQNRLENMILKIKKTANHKNNFKEAPPSYLQPY